MLVTSTIAEDPVIKALSVRIAAGASALALNGLWGSAAPIAGGCLAAAAKSPLFFVAAHLDQADDVRDDLETALGRAVEILPAWESLPGEGAASEEIGAERTRLCAALDSGASAATFDRPPLIVAPIQALMQPVPTPEALEANTLSLAVGDARGPALIAEFLAARGFDRLDQVEQPGDFALRGGILDIFASAGADPLRIEFFGDQIESLRHFDVGPQRSTRAIQSARITLPPNPAAARPADTTSFLNYLPADTLLALIEPLEIDEVARTVLDRLGHPVGHFPISAIARGWSRFRQLHLSRFPLATAADADTFRVHCEALPAFEARATDAVAQLIGLARAHPVEVFCDNRGEQDRLSELIAQVHGLAAPQDAPPAHRPHVSMQIASLQAGFIWKGGGDSSRAVAAVPHHDLFRRYTQKRRLRRVAATRPIETFLDLADGDYVVHVAHGIARFTGMKTMRKGDSRKSEEFLTLQFAESAVLHVPVSQIDLVQKYIGAKAARPPLSKLGGSRWAKTRARVEEAVDELAGDLLRIAAVRQSQTGVAYPNDTPWQTEFENAFLYTETPDQFVALRDIKSDMSRPRPMDRLLCGDVGYGKTELAMRAAFKAAEFGKQTAVLVPTTVLAEQHYRTFCERMAEYPFAVERLNRFLPIARQKEIARAAKKGQIDVLIGTHRLLSKDVDFADLGLVIIDEEQRFGVEHKEKLKHLRATVDVLTLSATPIPRTLHMAMIGLRDISSLATPPMDRRAITTRVCTWSDELVREAIIRELNRDGQVYFVHNRVHSIQSVAARIAALVPDARIIVGHGQMPGDELEQVMMQFIGRSADILVSTSIIESGLDIPNANTMFIDRADMFGLADLHQLRGRVGRYKHRAYCYLLLSPERPLTGKAAKRLKAIEEYSELGAGFRIAMRDLEIRGAGNILGPEQSGNIAAVGYELYCQLLEKSVGRMKGEAHRPRVAVHLELDVEAYIPKRYIASDRQRVDCYRRFAACHAPQDVERLAADLADAFGRLPDTVESLLTLTEIKVRAAGWRVTAINRKEPDVIFNFEGGVKQLEPLFTDASGKLRFADDRTLHWRLPENYFHGDTLLRVIVNLLRRSPRDAERAAVSSAPSTPTAGRRHEPSDVAEPI